MTGAGRLQGPQDGGTLLPYRGKRERKRHAARAAANALRALGEVQHAEAVESLLRSNSALAETCRRLWHDNRALRRGR
jgi:hypothetical protein